MKIYDYRSDPSGPEFIGTFDDAMLAVDPTGWALVSWDLIADLGWQVDHVTLCEQHSHPNPIMGLVEVTPVQRGGYTFFRYLTLHQQWMRLGTNSDPNTYLPMP